MMDKVQKPSNSEFVQCLLEDYSECGVGSTETLFYPTTMDDEVTVMGNIAMFLLSPVCVT
jgi:hypothetical protein